ncbi:MAG TPA: MaoC family dehydratase, partial [Acholeplasmataceae bacterium]|nr:MaoC family dehydratase [Acholeplasmataceae bacterium]
MGKTAHELFVGQKASFTKTLTEADVILFSGITGDLNPVHINQVYAEQTMFKNRIVHGGLVSALFSTVLGMYLPGNGTIFLEQDSKFV